MSPAMMIGRWWKEGSGKWERRWSLPTSDEPEKAMRVSVCFSVSIILGDESSMKYEALKSLTQPAGMGQLKCHKFTIERGTHRWNVTRKHKQSMQIPTKSTNGLLPTK